MSAENMMPTQEIHGTQDLPMDEDAAHQATQSSKIWGRLLPLTPEYEAVELENEEYTLGRHSSCAIILKDPTSSARHCRIYRKIADSKGRSASRSSFMNSSSDDMSSTDGNVATMSNIEPTLVIFIEDTSSNGTFINGKKIGKGNSIVLSDQDEISVAVKARKVFQFQDRSPEALKQAQTDCEEINERFILQKVLGTGATGEVRMAQDRTTGEKYAIKIINKTKFEHAPKARENFLLEGEILKSVNHPGVIKVFDVKETTTNIYIILELINGGELFDKIVEAGGFKEGLCKFITYQMLQALHHLHELNITHRDLKPENILVSHIQDSFLVKISDFGLAKIVGARSLMQTLCGTPNYLAPEVLISSGDGHTGYNKACDLWSLGVILYVCLSGTPPFSEDLAPPSLQEQITRGIFNFNDKVWKSVSSDAIDLVRSLLTVDPNSRITAEQALAHRWFDDAAVKEKVEKLYEVYRSTLPEDQATQMASRTSLMEGIEPYIAPHLTKSDDNVGEISIMPVVPDSPRRKARQNIVENRKLESTGSAMITEPIKRNHSDEDSLSNVMSTSSNGRPKRNRK